MDEVLYIVRKSTQWRATKMVKRTLIAKKTTRAKKSTVRVGKGIVVAASSNAFVKDLRPTDKDVVFYGPEPDFSNKQPSTERRLLEISVAYNWYSHFYSNKEAKEFLVHYMEEQKMSKNTIRLVNQSSENKMLNAAGWNARMAIRGLILDEREIEYIQKTIDRLTSSVIAVKEEKAESKEDRRTVQDVMRERASDASSEIEDMFDDFIAEGCPKEFAAIKGVISEYQSRNVLPQHMTAAIKHWNRIRNECAEVIEGKCDQLTEAYAKYSKTQLKNRLNFIDQILAQLNGYVSLKQTTKKVRQRKAVPVEKIVSHLKHLKTFKDPVQNLDLQGVSPVKLHGAAEAFVYDTRKRKLHYYAADNFSNTLTVKGNTLLGFDKKESAMKAIRRPQEQLEAVIGSKPAARKYFKEIRAVAACPNGRFNADMIILRAW